MRLEPMTAGAYRRRHGVRRDRAEHPEFVTYRNDRDFSGVVAEGRAGDLAPECIVFIPADQSPNCQDLIAAANEVSGTTTIYAVVK
ncbi:MAG: hypothetical protein ACOCWR_01860 [Oceanidesulfovibrio sp.]